MNQVTPQASRVHNRTKVLNLLQEAIDLCLVGDIDENTDDSLGWGVFVGDAKAALEKERAFDRMMAAHEERRGPDGDEPQDEQERKILSQILGADLMQGVEQLGPGVYSLKAEGADVETILAKLGEAGTHTTAGEAPTKEPVDEELLRSTDVGGVWACEFRKVFPNIDEGTMVGWFTNCAETAKALLGNKHAAERSVLRSALRMVLSLKQLGGMLPGTAQIVASVVETAEEALGVKDQGAKCSNVDEIMATTSGGDGGSY